MIDTIQQIALWALPVLVAIIFHEVSHGWVAYRLGDPTAARMGRLTLNPIAHIDPIGTILLPALLIISNAPFLFGYAKPVPVNFHNLRNPKRDMVWVASAGPVMNLLLASSCILVLKIGLPLIAAGTIDSSASGLVNFLAPVALMAKNGVLINVVLAVFNALPLPHWTGQSGGGITSRTLPSMLARAEPYGFLILIILLMTHALDKIIGPPIDFLINFYFKFL